MHAEVLEMEHVDRSFGRVRALKDVSLTVHAGEIHAVVGENGAGKSTLMAIASGALVPDRGSVRIGGVELQGGSAQARQLGLGIVRQHPALLPQLTVAENLWLGARPDLGRGVADAVPWAREHLSRWSLGIDPRARVQDLPVHHRTIVEIAKALALQPRVLVLDEPTEHLEDAEVTELFARIREVVAIGTGVVYISHRVREVKSLADRISVLRDGESRGTHDADGITEDRIVSLVLGRQLDAAFPAKNGSVPGDPVLEVASLSGSAFDDVSFSVGAGEVVGLAGIDGNGQREVLNALGGVIDSRGDIRVCGRRVRNGSVRAASSAGIALVPQDRARNAVLAPLSVAENMVAPTIGRHATMGVVRTRRAYQESRAESARLAVKAPSLDTPIQSLSGGNQQKVMLSRATLQRPAILLAEEPAQGVDAGARVEIYKTLRDLADDGSAVMVASADALELAGLCDRVLVFSRGRLQAELRGDQVCEAGITSACLTATNLRARHQGRRRLRWGAALGSDRAPAGVLAAIVALLGIFAAARNGDYATSANISSLLLILTPLIFVSAAQLLVVLGGGIDLSVGPAVGLALCVSSFYLLDGATVLNVVTGLLALGAVGVAIGTVNAGLVTFGSLTPVVATLATYMALRAASLLVRPVPEGVIGQGVIDTLHAAIGPVPIALLVAVALVLALEWVTRRTPVGVALRAVGDDEATAATVGVNVRRVRVASYVAAACIVTVGGGLMLAAQNGVGDPNAGIDYTLMSITAVVLGGANIFGGRGSFLGALMGAALIAQVNNVTTFLQLNQAWPYWLLAILTVGGAALFSYGHRRTDANGS